MEKLTDRQYDILQIIKKLIAKNGYPPTVREIGDEAKLSSPATIHFHIKQLVKKGYIKKGSGTNRTIEVLVDNEYLDNDDEVVILDNLDVKKDILLPDSKKRLFFAYPDGTYILKANNKVNIEIVITSVK